MSNMARTKQTARLGTGSVSAQQTQAWRTLTTVQASSYDPPIIPTTQSDRVETLLALFAEDDLNRDAVYRFEDTVEPTLTGRVSRKRREDLIAECKAQIVAERAAADAAGALLSLVPTQTEPVDQDQPEPVTQDQTEDQAAPEEAQAITGSKRNRGHLKTKGSIIHTKSKGEHAPEFWTVTYKRCRNTFIL